MSVHTAPSRGASDDRDARAPMTVPFLDLGATYRELRAELDAATGAVLASGRYLLGPELQAFEREFGAYVGAAECIGVANGLDALALALRALGVGAGDEVIVPSHTFVATWLAASAVGARLVPVEPDERTYNIDPERVAAAITPRTRVILPVHLYGQPADMPALRAIAAPHGVRVLEDAAQSHGARCHGVPTGALGDAAAWSFYPGKNLGAFGDAGGVTTDDPALAEQVRMLRNYGSREKYVNEVKGVNSRMEELHAAMLRVKLRHLDAWNARRARQAALYRELLADAPVVLPHVPDWATPAWHLFVVRTPARARVQAALRARGVETLIHYPIPPHRQAAYADLGLAEGSFPIAERLHREVLSLPIGPHLSDDQVRYVADCLRNV